MSFVRMRQNHLKHFFLFLTPRSNSLPQIAFSLNTHEKMQTLGLIGFSNSIFFSSCNRYCSCVAAAAAALQKNFFFVP